MRHILSNKGLKIALGIETTILVVVLGEVYYRKQFVDKLQELALYYADMLKKGKVDLSDDYDLIALCEISDHPALRDFA